jgi:hypothetical protein
MEISKKRLPYFIVAGVAIVGLILAGYFYYELRKARQNPQIQSQKEVKNLVSRVGRIVVLPEGETPTVATVSDPEVLKKQSFFSMAEKDDKVLIYSESKKAILYRPSINKIIEMAPLSIGSNINGQQSDSVVESLD